MKTPNRITRLSNAALNYLKKTTGTCECEPYNHVSQCESSREIFEECATPELILLLILEREAMRKYFDLMERLNLGQLETGLDWRWNK